MIYSWTSLCQRIRGDFLYFSFN